MGIISCWTGQQAIVKTLFQTLLHLFETNLGIIVHINSLLYSIDGWNVNVLNSYCTLLVVSDKNWEIPEVIVVRSMKEEGEMIVLCASCGLQRGDRISIPGLGRKSTRRYSPSSLQPLQIWNVLSVRTTHVELPRHISSSHPYRSCCQPLGICWDLYLISTKRHGDEW